MQIGTGAVTRSALLLVASFLALAGAACGGAMGIGEKRAVEIADARGGELNTAGRKLKVRATRHSTPWNDCIPKETDTPYLKERMEKLKGKSYWAVYYYPDPGEGGKGVKGGDFCVFVDAETGEVLTEVRWK